MKRQSNTEFTDLRHRAWERAVKLSSDHWTTSPQFVLAEYASVLSVRRLQVQPMLSTAAIGVVDDGYVVYLNVRSRGVSSMGDKPISLAREHIAHLNSSLRFSIAHEMSHVFFFTEFGEHRKGLLRRHWLAIENSCSQMARVLLLPKKAILAQIGRDQFSAASISNALKHFVVSPQVFLYRLRLPDLREPLDHPGGFLFAYIREHDGEPVIAAAHSAGTLAGTRWTTKDWRKKSQPLSMLQVRVDLRSLIYRREVHSEEIEVPWGQHRQIALGTLEISPLPTRRCEAILTIRLSGSIEKES